jgi:hypothetical protein
MLIQSTPGVDEVELGGDETWRSEDRGARGESRMGRSQRNPCEFDVHGDENLPDIWKTVESATGADPVTVIRSHWMRVLEDGLMRRRYREGNTIAQIAMRRIRCKPEQQSAE